MYNCTLCMKYYLWIINDAVSIYTIQYQKVKEVVMA
jgi:hypothetical protein